MKKLILVVVLVLVSVVGYSQSKDIYYSVDSLIQTIAKKEGFVPVRDCNIKVTDKSAQIILPYDADVEHFLGKTNVDFYKSLILYKNNYFKEERRKGRLVYNWEKKYFEQGIIVYITLN